MVVATPYGFNNTLIEGDPLEPTDTDLILQRAMIEINTIVPDGWRVLTGNSIHSQVARVAYRYEIEGEADG